MWRRLTEVFPISCAVPRPALVHGQGILEQYSPRFYVFMKDGRTVKYRRLIRGEEIVPLMRQGG